MVETTSSISAGFYVWWGSVLYAHVSSFHVGIIQRATDDVLLIVVSRREFECPLCFYFSLPTPQMKWDGISNCFSCSANFLQTLLAYLLYLLTCVFSDILYWRWAL